jgi:hypothetical protein
MIHRLVIYRLKQEVNNQRKYRAITGNKEEEAHRPSPRKIRKEIQLHAVIEDQSKQLGNTSDNRPNGGLSKM